MHDVTTFSLSDMTECSAAMRGFGAGAKSMEEVARRTVRYLYDELIDRSTGERSCTMVRFYKTHAYGDMDAQLMEFARSMLGDHPATPTMRCLVLLASAGEKPEWNSRKCSVGHQAIPLPSEKIVENFPMVSQLVRQFGLDLEAVVKPKTSLLLDHEQRTYNVFHVPDAVGSPYVPAQEDFVIPFKVKSVLGFGGVLPSADLFAIILFSKAHIPRETADLFKILALSAKVAILPFLGRRIFD